MYHIVLIANFSNQSQNEKNARHDKDYPASEMHYVVNNKKVYSVDNYWNSLKIVIILI